MDNVLNIGNAPQDNFNCTQGVLSHVLKCINWLLDNVLDSG